MNKPKNKTYRGKKLRPRGKAWQVDFGAAGGKRVQRSYPTLIDAKAAIDAHHEEQRMEAIDEKNKRIGLYGLTDAQRVDVMAALEVLGGHAPLTEAAEFYMHHNAPEAGAKTVAELLEEFAAAKEKANRRPRTIEDIRNKLGRFAVDYGDRPVHEISRSDLEKWMDRKGYEKITRDNYRRHFVAFWNFAQKREYCRENPASKIESITTDEKIPEILTAKQVKALMLRAQAAEPRMVPYFAVAFFAGLRPSEIESLDWRDIDLTKRRITVRPEVAKRRRQRYVDISDNLALWLAPYAQSGGKLYFTRYQFDRVKDSLIDQWPHDVMRHTYGSFHLGKHEDAAKTALQMGHTTTKVLFHHYRDLVTREDAEEFWSINPKHEANVIPLRSAAQ